MSSSPAQTPNAVDPLDVERTLAAQIEPWLGHMRWRSDFAEWRQRRLWQENYQDAALDEVRAHATAACDSAAGRVEWANVGRILDLGAGMGGFVVALARAGAQPVGLDYNSAYCEIARTRARRYDLNLPALVGAGEALPFANASFHIVTCWDVLEHAQDPRRLLAEIARVLDAAGVCFLTVINRFALVDPHYHLRFLNYLPRALGEQYIVWRRRAKASALRDKQQLREMHYFTYATFRALTAECGLALYDLNRAHSRLNRYPPPLGSALYVLWRTLGMGTYRFVLRKTSFSPAGGPA